MLSGVGATKNAKRTALVHLSFNVIGTAVWLAVFALVRSVFQPALLEMSADAFGIAVSHSVFNVLCTILLFPCSGLLEKLVCRLVPDSEEPEQVAELDERLLATPPVALMSCREMTAKMADAAAQGLRDSASLLTSFDPATAKAVKKIEGLTDHYEDILGTYLVKLSSLSISADDNAEAAMLLKAINDFERIGDHSVNLMESAQEIHEKELSFSDAAKQELAVLLSAVSDIVELSFRAFLSNDLSAAMAVEPLEEVVDDLTDAMRSGHIQRLQQGSCSIETGFVWTDLLTSLERVGDHCSNIAGCVIDLHRHDMNTHEALRQNRKGNARFDKLYAEYSAKYHL
jgi:phosphate:Na+ symporter